MGSSGVLLRRVGLPRVSVVKLSTGTGSRHKWENHSTLEKLGFRRPGLFRNLRTIKYHTKGSLRDSYKK